MDLLAEFRKAIEIEQRALESFSARLDPEVVTEIVDRLFGCRGRVVVIGMGKCGHIARKMAATFASTGTPSTFIHPAEAVHGDLGFVGKDDVALILSNSGETPEIVEVLVHLKRLGVDRIALTGQPRSTVARYCDLCLNTAVDLEADPLNMAPTASTTLLLAVGDALAAVLMKKRAFGKTDYAVFHPGGSLGQKLLCLVGDLMHAGKDVPISHEDISLKDAIVEMTSKRLGTTLVVDGDRKLLGVLTDGDLRRVFQKEPDRATAVAAMKKLA